ncbi:MAG: alanine--tRNA ligase [Alphaproteobacteria bacterium]|nr:alanine--tRNA ligase [Alphaproteobacteria bacterium]
MQTGADIRREFLSFFEEKGHEVVPSSSLVPSNDPTLMFTNSGMVQFKNMFTGVEKRGYTRAASSQRCVRAGGKHNDLENVGNTARHHTFFEMLGNFSFGDYFKEESITWAWELLTERLKLDPSKMCVTIYHDDNEAHKIWNQKIGIADKDIIRIDTSDNFWTMGDTGPCGPCTEIFYDLGSDIAGDRPGTPDEDGDRFMEIWNLVFTQFDLQPNGDKLPLAMKNIDTGAGLERLMCVAQGVQSNYDTDIFQSIIGKAGQLTGVNYGANTESDVSLRVLADHLRAMTFLLVDGVMPSNEGRGYVLRRIMRRAMRHGHLLGVNKPFINSLVPTLVDVMGEAYPELKRAAPMAKDVIELEENRFSKTLTQGLKILDEESNGLKDGDTLAGEVAFKLYDTYGFPMDLTADVLKSRGVTVDEEGFASSMTAQKERARSAGMGGTGQTALSDVWYDLKDKIPATEFLGYTGTEAEAQVTALVKDDASVDSLKAGDKGILVVGQTPFYAESGGQVGDTGIVTFEGGSLKVTDTQKVLDGMFIHHVTVESGDISVGTDVMMTVDAKRRGAIVANHSATHLMHKALQETLGDHVFQKGSVVSEDRLRFDFSQPKAMTPEEITKIEDRVNGMIRANLPVETRVMDKDKAVEMGAMALFGEKYDDDVRVVFMGDDALMESVELCGGTHVKRTGDIGLFKLTSESAISAGVRRIEAVTGEGAFNLLRGYEQSLKGMADSLKTSVGELPERISALQADKKKLEADLKNAKKGGGNAGADLTSSAEDVAGVKFISSVLDAIEPALLREMVDDLKNKIGSGVVVLATENDGKSTFVAGVTQDLTAKFKAGDLVNAAAATVGGKGGGRPDMAMAGGKSGDLTAAIHAAKGCLTQ